MSKSNRNVTSSRPSNKIRVKISDVNESSRSSKLQSDMSASKDTHRKSSVEDDIFDSGIHSESNLSSGIISEGDISCENISKDLRYDSATFSKPSLDQTKVESFSSDYKSEVIDSMNQDSGIDIDLSDYSGRYLSAEIYSPSAKLSSNDIVCDAAAKQVSTPVENILWRLFYDPVDDVGNNELQSAVIQGREDIVQRILKLIPDSYYLDIQNYYRMTCLHLSVMLNQPKITRLLLLAGAKTGIEDRNGNTPVHLASLRNYTLCARALLSPVTVYEQNYNVFQYRPTIDRPQEYINEFNYDGETCIHVAARHPDMKILHILLSNGGDVNIRECKGGYTILHNAVRTGNHNLLSFILQHSGIDLESRNYARLTPYQLSAYHPRLGAVLLAQGAQKLFIADDESDEDSDSDDDDDVFDNFTRSMSNMINSLNTSDSTATSAS